MGHNGSYQATIDKLYALYEENGFISEEVALEMMTADNVSFVGINRITDKLLAMGAVFVTEAALDDEDYTQTNYEELYKKVLEISPNQKQFIDYLREIRPPQKREWRELLAQYKSGNDYAYKRLFEMYLRVVIKVAMYYDYENTGIFDLDDAIQEGTFGLMQAIKSYDASQNSYFASYVNNWIRQRIDRAIADVSRTIRIPIHLLETVNIVRRKSEELFQRYGREPFINEIAESLNFCLSYDHIVLIQGLLEMPLSLDVPIDEEDEIYLSDIIPDTYEEDSGFVATCNRELKRLVIEILATLSERENYVLRLRYGLNDDVCMTLEEIGDLLGVTRERVRQIEARAIRKLNHPSKAKRIKDFY